MSTTNEPSCCTVGSATNEQEAPKKAQCPRCGQSGSRVGRQTVEALVVEEQRESLGPEQYYYCTTTTCEVVYFASNADSPSAVIEKDQLRVRVGLKETEDPIPVCYCFDHTRESIAAEIRETGSSDVVERVRAEVSAGRCSCEVRNPSGKCCLGELMRTVEELKGNSAARSAATEPPSCAC